MYCPHWYLPLNSGNRMYCNGEIRCELINSILGLTDSCVFNMAIKEISNGCRMVCKDLRSVLLNSPNGKICPYTLYVVCMYIHSSFGKDSSVRISNYHINGKWHKEHVPDSLWKKLQNRLKHFYEIDFVNSWEHASYGIKFQNTILISFRNISLILTWLEFVGISGSNDELALIGLASNRRRSIILINDTLVFLRIWALPGLDEFDIQYINPHFLIMLYLCCIYYITSCRISSRVMWLQNCKLFVFCLFIQIPKTRKSIFTCVYHITYITGALHTSAVQHHLYAAYICRTTSFIYCVHLPFSII